MSDEWLSELAAFARAYPAQTSRLAETSMDPDVERLADGFDYLAAKIRRIVDRGSLELIEPFAELVCPELLRPLPSGTILEVLASPPRSKRIAVPAGAQFGSVPREGTACVFRAMSSFEIIPWTMTDVHVEWTAEQGQAVVLGLAPNKPTVSLTSLFPLRLHFSGDTPDAETLLFWFCRRLTAIELRVEGSGPRQPRELTIPADVRHWGLDRAQALLPIEPREHPGFRLLREYFLLPQKFSFVDVQGPAFTSRDKADRVSLVFRFDAMFPTRTSITKETVRLNCVPVVNVFEATSDPIQPSLEHPLHALRVAGVSMDHAEIYAIRSAEMTLAGESEPRPAPPMVAFGATLPESLPGAFYATHAAPRRRIESDLCVSFGSAADAGPLPPITCASFTVWATNGTLAPLLGASEVCMPTAGGPAGLAFRNIRAITPYVPAPHAGGLRERATAFMAMTARQGQDTARLRCILRCLDPNGLTRTQAGRAEAKRIAAIESVRSTPGRVRSKGALIRGQDIEVKLGQGTFQGEGEVFVFASILDHLFSYEAPLNSYTQTTIHWTPTGLAVQFPPRHAGRPVS